MDRNFESGTFVTGCNYWASHAGMYMWRNWSPETVAADLELLAANHLKMLRVFPLWPDFQPLQYIYQGSGNPLIAMNEEPLPDTEAGQAGVDEAMMARFRFMADEAEKNGIRLIVGLVTGWMSGRLFVPPAFEAVNVITNPEAVKWQVRFVRYFVRHMKDHPAVAAWDLGNECNCMGPATSAEAWNWTHAVASAIRLEDNTRPVVSGMHSLSVDKSRPWLIEDQAELTDILTTHPYPLFTPKCNLEPFNTLRNTLHATAESCLYGDIGNRPCIPEEVGSLGPMVCSDERAGAYLQSALFSCWAHDLRGLLWWCAFDQDHLTQAPYDWVGLERELGLFRKDYSEKPVVESVRKFNEAIGKLPFGKLPPRKIDAVCLLTSNQKHWEVAFGAFILAKQAGYDIAFHDAAKPLPESPLYIVPSISNYIVLTRRRYGELLAKVEAGARVLVTAGNGMLQPFEPVFGIKVDYRCQEEYREMLKPANGDGCFSFPLQLRQRLQNVNAEILGVNDAGDPMFTRCAYGKGEAWFLNFPLEEISVDAGGMFYGEKAQPFYRIYRKFFQEAGAERLISKDNPDVGVTEHKMNDGSVIGVLVNYCPETAVTGFRPVPGWEVAATLYGNADEIPGNSAAVVELRKKKEERRNGE